MPKTNKWKTSQGYIYTHTTHTAIITKWQTKGKKKKQHTNNNDNMNDTSH